MKNKVTGNGETMLEVVFKYFGAIMAVVYVGAGLMILIQSSTFYNIPVYYSVPLGISLIGYGAFRGYRVYKKYFQIHHESDT